MVARADPQAHERSREHGRRRDDGEGHQQRVLGARLQELTQASGVAPGLQPRNIMSSASCWNFAWQASIKTRPLATN